MSNGNGHHYSKFCWRDWSSDKALHPCSLAAKGFWIEMLCIMHEGSPIGHLTLGGKPATIRQMAANAYCTEKEAKKYLAELEDAGVFSRTDDGTIYSRRMVRDAELSEVQREHGKKGGNPQLRPQRPNGHDTPPKNPSRGVNPPLNPNLNHQPYGYPKPPGLTQGLTGALNQESELEVQTEPEREEERVFNKKTSFSGGTPARAERRDDALDALLSETGSDKPPRIDRTNDEPPSTDPVVLAHIRRAKKALEMRIPYGEVRSVEAQIDALKAQPAAVGADEAMGLKWQPHEPVRTPAQQYAELTGCSLAEAEARFADIAA